MDVGVGRGNRMTLVLPVHEGALARLAAGAIFLFQREGSASPGKSRLLNESIERSPVLLSLLLDIINLLVFVALTNRILNCLSKCPVNFIDSLAWICSRLLNLI